MRKLLLFITRAGQPEANKRHVSVGRECFGRGGWQPYLHAIVVRKILLAALRPDAVPLLVETLADAGAVDTTRRELTGASAGLAAAALVVTAKTKD